jgi:hypothetical protein
MGSYDADVEYPIDKNDFSTTVNGIKSVLIVCLMLFTELQVKTASCKPILNFKIPKLLVLQAFDLQ